MNIESGIKETVEVANSIISWSLLILGGSTATLLGSDYLRPHKRLFRYIYILFIPGWISLGIAIYFGNQISNRSIMAAFSSDNSPRLLEITQKINLDYANERSAFFLGLIFFGIWLLFFLLWWVFNNDTKN